MTPSLLLYRIGHALHVRGWRRTGLALSRLNRVVFNVWLPSSARLGEGSRLGSWGLGVVIHSNATIGRNCLIGQHVTIGRNLGDQGVPTVGDNVYIGAGAVVFGEIELGDNCIVGANSVVNKSVPAGTIVAGNPAKPIGTTGGRTYRELDGDTANGAPRD